MSEDSHLSLRERTRRAVQAELVDVAQRLFVEQGYEATTVDSITEAAGLSKRSFFRYFASKEDLVMGKYDLMGEQLQAGLTARPADEPVWTALRRMFDDVIAYTADTSNSARMDEMERIVSASPALNAAYLQRLDQMQSDLATIVRDREEQAGRPRAATDPSPEAIVGAAFACMAAARRTAIRFDDQSLPDLVDRAMSDLWTFDR
ncbi:TetR/AcrR family transcriptional regulator [Modestobacter altitudinis]|uniref:TetR/AcrR family transcriptional regulator n=1 Tax=Modestobacter altitudinis TaxID=2213158 RepID=UPI001486D772|nr:TetR/AcrR family transcriptional regulator [Modestobacter altitudinis]